MTKIIKKDAKSDFKISKNIKRRNKRNQITLLPWFKPSLNFNDLPRGVIVDIFSYFSREELFKTVRLVCKQWYTLANSASLWKTIKAGPDVPRESLLKWLENAPKLKSLKLQNRIDAGDILRKVHKYNRKIQSLRIQDCWGCERRINLPSAPLCNILLKCPYLDKICLKGSKFISCKFFRMLASRDLILAKRKRNIDHERKSKRIRYYGTAMKRQLLAFIKSRMENNRHKLSMVTVRTNTADGSREEIIREEIIIRSKEDIERIFDILNFR